MYSAIGLLAADFRFDLSRGIHIRLSQAGARAQLRTVFDSLEGEARNAMHEQGHKAQALVLTSSADMRYLGQSYEVNVGFETSAAGAADPEALRRRFDAEHARVYGHANENEPVEIITARVSARIPAAPLALASGGDAAERASSQLRTVAFDGVSIPTRVLTRNAIGDGIEGPVAIEQSDTTIIVPPRARLLPLANGFLLLELGSLEK